MKLFGFEIKRSQPEQQKSNALLRRLLPGFYWGRDLPTETDFKAQLECYKSWVYIASSLNATSVAQVPLRLYVAKPSKDSKSRFPTKEISLEQKSYLTNMASISKIPAVRKSVDIEEVLDHPILDLLRNVNNFNNGFDLIEITQMHQELTGNAYWYVKNNKLGIPSEIWTIPPDRIKVVPDPNVFIRGYDYHYAVEKFEFPESEIIHFKIPNPRNLYYGLSPLMAVIEAYNTNVNMQKYENSIFKNMGRLSGAFETEESLDDEDFERLKQELGAALTGIDNIGKAPLLDKGITYKEYGMKPNEMGYLEGRNITKEEIYNAYGQTLGLYDKTATRANSEAAQRMYATRTILPRCLRLADKLNEKLIPKYGFPSYMFLAFENPVPEDRLIALKERTENIRAGITTINQERHKMRMEPIKGGDEPLVQAQYLPLSAIISGANQVQAPVDVQTPNESNKPQETPPPKKPGNGKMIEEEYIVN